MVVEENRKTAKQLLDRKHEQLAALFPAGVTGSTTLPKTPFRGPHTNEYCSAVCLA